MSVACTGEHGQRIAEVNIGFTKGRRAACTDLREILRLAEKYIRRVVIGAEIQQQMRVAAHFLIEVEQAGNIADAARGLRMVRRSALQIRE